MIDSWEENPGPGREKAVEELIRGRECADRLRALMENPSENDGSISKDDLLNKILISFSNTLSVLRKRDLALDEVSQIPVGSPPADSRRSEDSGESIRSSVTKNRRGCYKRRKSANSWAREDSPRPFEDGHSWRKYGQKNILRAKHPRNYFRCTHKYDQKCQATKQVQKIRDDPAVFRTTYYGHHTCRDLLDTPHLILHSPDADADAGRSSVYLSFNKPGVENDLFTLSNQPVKQEAGDHEMVGSDLLPARDDQHPTVLDSCTASSGGHSLDMMDSFDFDIDVFSFDFS